MERKRIQSTLIKQISIYLILVGGILFNPKSCASKPIDFLLYGDLAQQTTLEPLTEKNVTSQEISRTYQAGTNIGGTFTRQLLSGVGISPHSELGSFVIHTQFLWTFGLLNIVLMLYWVYTRGRNSTLLVDNEVRAFNQTFYLNQQPQQNTSELHCKPNRLVQPAEICSQKLNKLKDKFSSKTLEFDACSETWSLYLNLEGTKKRVAGVKNGSIVPGMMLDSNLHPFQNYILTSEKKWLPTKLACNLLLERDKSKVA